MDLLAGRVLGYVLILTRVGTFLLAAPVFGWESIPRQFRLCLALLVSMFFAGRHAYAIPAADQGSIEVLLWVAYEAIYGLALGLICAILFGTIRVSARVIEQEMGLSLANVIDPLTGQMSQPLGMLLEIVLIMLFLAAGGHHMLIQVLAGSYEKIPVGSTPDIARLAKAVTAAGSLMMLLGLKLASPILGASLLAMVVLAVMARVAPEANVLFLSFPLRIGMGLILVGIFVPFTNSFVKEFTKYLQPLLPF